MTDRNQLIRNGDTIALLAGQILKGEALATVPELVEMVIKEGMWKDRIVGSSGQRVTYADFKKFVEAAPLEGLGQNIDKLMKLCEGTPAQTEIERLIPALNPNGRPKNETVIYNSFEDRQRGTSRDYRIAVLKRDAPDLAEQVISKDISAAEGMRRLKERQGIPRPNKVTVNMADLEAVAKVIRHHLSADQISELIEYLQDDMGNIE